MYSWSPDTLNNKLEEVSKKIESKATEISKIRERKKIAIIKYKFRRSKLIKTEKLKNPDRTQTDLNCIADSDIEVYKLNLKMIMAESKHSLVKEEMAALRDKLDVLKEKSYNMREEMRSLKGTDSQGKPGI